MLHVPYRGAAPAVTDVATGTVTMSFTSLAAAQGLIQAGKVRAVAVTSLERMPQLPDVAPLQKARRGLKATSCSTGSACSRPPARRRRSSTRLNAIVNDALKQPKLAEFLTVQGIVPRPMNAAEYKKFVAAETEKFGMVVKQANIKFAN